MKNSLIIVFCFLSLNIFAQVTFQRTYQHQTSAEANTVCKTLDGGYLMAGRTSDGTNILYSDCYLVKTDSLGNVQWRKAYGGSGFEDISSVLQLSDGNYILCGKTNSFNVNNIFLVKTNDTGKIIWQKSYGDTTILLPRMVKQTMDNGFVVVGAYLDSIYNYETYLVKTDSMGNLVWTKTYATGTGANGNYVNPIKDSGYIITGYHRYVNGSGDMYAMKTNSVGNIIWAKSYGTTVGSSINATDATDDGGYILAGLTSLLNPQSPDIYLNKIDSVGGLKWSKLYNRYADLGSIKKNDKGDFILTGATSGNNNIPYVLLMKINKQGTLKWNRVIGRLALDGGKEVEPVDSSGYIITGFTTTTPQSTRQFYLIKTDSLGYSGCNTDSVSFTETIPNTIVDTLIFTVSSFDRIGTLAFTITSYDGTDSILCYNDGSNAVHEVSPLQKDVMFFPNPTTGIINIQAKSNIHSVKITNTKGEIIYSLNTINSKKITIDLNHTARGIYFYQIQTVKGIISGKLLLE